jgi:hypothetical protein
MQLVAFMKTTGSLGTGHTGLGSVVSVVQANGNEFAHSGYRATHAWLATHQGQFFGFELA